jgi:hypothetical protein
MKAKQREDQRKRADLLLVERGFFESRAKAQEAIAGGHVTVDGRLLRKASETIADTAIIEAASLYPWVSRGGLKLVAALRPAALRMCCSIAALCAFTRSTSDMGNCMRGSEPMPASMPMRGWMRAN